MLIKPPYWAEVLILLVLKRVLGEPMTRVELVTFSLPRKRSTPELHRPISHFFLVGQLPCQHTIFNSTYERETRLEPATYSLEGCRSTN